MTADQLRELFEYNPDTGVLISRTRRANCIQVGAVAGHINRKGYRVIKVQGKAYKAHRLALLYVTGAWPMNQVDHVNGVKDDNRLVNLRDVDATVNAQNKWKAVRGSASGLVGAHRGGWKKRRWTSSIEARGGRVYLGIFHTAEEAHAAYLAAKRELHGGPQA